LVSSKIELLHKSREISNQLREEANELYRSGNLLKALHGYTLSICYAPEKTKALLLGYSNRSACFKELNYAKSSLTDIASAFKILKEPLQDLTDATEIKKISQKLVDRKERCDQVTDSSHKHKESLNNFFTLRKPNLLIPSAEYYVHISSNSEMGRHVVVSEDVKPGIQ